MSRRPPGELAIKPTRTVVLTRQYMQTAGRTCASVERDVGAAPGHARGHGDTAAATGFGHDCRFIGIVQGVEHPVPDAAFVQQRRQALGIGHAVGAHQHGTSSQAQLIDTLNHGSKHRLCCGKTARRQVLAPAAQMQRDANDACAVDGV